MTTIPFLDTGALHDIAHRIRTEADTVRAGVARLGTATAATRWRSSAADAFRARAETLGRSLLATAAALDQAADALDRHANQVGDLVAASLALMKTGLAEGERALNGAADAVGDTVGDAVDGVTKRFKRGLAAVGL